jgi:beta-glucosidase
MTATNSGPGAVAPVDAAYRDPTRPVDERVEDLLRRMTPPEKAGMLFQDMVVVGADGALSDGAEAFGIMPTERAVGELHMTHFNLLGAPPDIRVLAEWHNRLQDRARRTRLGIPITLSTDPRHHFTDNPGTAAQAGVFSQWPEPLGLAAIRSSELVERFADIARQEYVAVGLRSALHPQVDLATEPRWARVGAGFGEDAELTGELAAAYIRGFQGSELGPGSVSTMTKHFPGGGPQKDGEDPHFAYGREQVYPGDNLAYHVKPFRVAIAAGTAKIMPYYGMPVGTDYEQVGFAFDQGIITGLLREQLGFDGIVCTDWGLVTDTQILGQDMPARAWGVEHLDELSRVERILLAGCDQLGGESRPELVIALLAQGRIAEERLDVSVRRLLREKFVLGLFDNPFVDVDAAVATVGRADFVAAGAQAQRRSATLLINPHDLLPLGAPRRLYVEGIDPDLAGQHGQLVDDPAAAEVALVRLKAPYEPRPGGFEARFHAGSLEFPDEQVRRLSRVCAAVPTVIDVHLDRPAVLTPLATTGSALIASFGMDDAAFLDVVFGNATPEGALPFDLPRSMAAVVASRSDVPFDTESPLFRFGHGLRYRAAPQQPTG